MAGNTLTINITANDADALAALKRTAKQLDATGDAADKASRQGFGLRDALAGVAIGAGLGKAIGEFEEAQKTAAQTAAVIRSTGNAAQVSAAQQDEMVASLSKLAAVDDEVVAGGANVLRTFTQVKGEAFEPALASALDLSAALGTDLQSATLQVGKALNDPVKGLTSLTRAGVSFTAQQKEQIKALAESGDTLGAQKLILAELERQFGGSAEANATSSAKMKIAFDDAAESLGASLAPGLTVVASGAEKASAAFQALPQPLQAAAVAGAGLAIVGPRIVDGIGSAASTIKGLADSAVAAKGKIGGVIESMGGVGTVAPVAGAAVGVAGLALYGFAQNAANAAARMAAVEQGVAAIRAEMDATGKSAKQATIDIAVVDTWERWGGSLKDAGISVTELGNGITGTKEQAQSLADEIRNSPLSEDTKFALLAELDKLRNQYVTTTEETKRNKEATAALGITQDKTTGSTKALGDALSGLGSAAAAGAAGGFDALAEKQERVGRLTEDLHDKQSALADAMVDEASAAENVTSANESLADAREGVADAIERYQEAQAAVPEAMRDEAEAAQGVQDALADVATAEQDLADARREATGDSDDMRDALEGVADAQERLTERQQDSIEAVRELDEVVANYSQTLAGLSRDAEGAADDVKLAEIALRKAKQAAADLGKPDKDGKTPKVTADEREEAAIRIREAERRLAELQERAAKAQEDLNRNQANGVEGSDDYIAASENVTAAKEAEQAAHEDLEGAVQNVADTQVAANQRVSDAEQTLAEKIAAVQTARQTQIDAHGKVVEAQRNVQKASEDVGKAEAEVSKRAGEVNKANQDYVAAKNATRDAKVEVAFAEGALAKATADHATAQGNLATNANAAGGALSGAFAKGMNDALNKFDPNDPRVQMMRAILTLIYALNTGAAGGLGDAAANALGGVLKSSEPGGKGRAGTTRTTGDLRGGANANRTSTTYPLMPWTPTDPSAPLDPTVVPHPVTGPPPPRGGVRQPIGGLIDGRNWHYGPGNVKPTPTIQIDMTGVHDPAAVVEMTGQRMDWLVGAAGGR